MAHVWREQALFDELHEIVVAEPGAHHAAVLGLGEGRANAHADGLDAIAIEVEARHVFTERFGQAVVTIRPAAHVGVELFVLLVKADHMVGAGKHHALDAVAARRFVEVEDAFDIGLQHLFKRALHRHATHVHNRVAAGHQGIHRLLVGQVANHHLFAAIPRRRHARHIGQAQDIRIRAQALTQHLSQATGGAGQ